MMILMTRYKVMKQTSKYIERNEAFKDGGVIN